MGPIERSIFKMFFELAECYQGTLSDFMPYSPASSRQAWEGLEPNLKREIIKNAEPYLNYNYPSIPATLYMKFCRMGNRTDFEEVYFKRRNVLNTLVLAECVEYQGRFLDDIINGIFVLCEESGWQLPPHNSYMRHTPNRLLPDVTAPVLDLFACETGAELAMIYYLLKQELSRISLDIPKRIMHELDTRIIKPYLDTHFWWMGNGNEPMCNWTIWCTQNILLTTFTTGQSEYVKSRVFKKATQSIDYFLKEYGDDGCCDEGAQYYRHAALCLFNAMEVLNGVTNNYFSSLYENQKIKNMAAYIDHVHVSGPYYINFADCSAKAGFAGVREFLFGKRTWNLSLMSFAAEHYQANPDPLLQSEINLFYRIQSIFTHQEITHFKPTSHPKPDLFYPSVGLFIARDKNFCLAVKAGDNDDSHNHNDTGSFTIYKHGQPLFVDIGVESYTKKTFSSERYDIWTMQSDYHNTPTINHLMQKAGAHYKATNVQTCFTDATSFIKMNLATAYPDNGNLTSYHRQVSLYKDTVYQDNRIVITDTIIPNSDINSDSNIILNLITYEKPSLQNEQILIGQLAILELSPCFSHIEIEQLPITDPRLALCWDHDLYRIRITLNQLQATLTIH